MILSQQAILRLRSQIILSTFCNVTNSTVTDIHIKDSTFEEDIDVMNCDPIGIYINKVETNLLDFELFDEMGDVYWNEVNGVRFCENI